MKTKKKFTHIVDGTFPFLPVSGVQAKGRPAEYTTQNLDHH